MEENKVNAESTEPAADAPKLTISELNQIAVVINTAVKRGAFDAEEVGLVSALYKNLKAFVDQFAPKPEAGEQK